MKQLRIVALMAVALAAAGCSAQDSATRHARHYATHHTAELNGNFTEDAEGTARLIRPTFEIAYKEGAELRRTGATRAELEKQIADLKKQILSSIVDETGHFNGNASSRSSDRADPRDVRLMADELAGAVRDGYNEASPLPVQNAAPPVDDLLGGLKK